MKEKMTHPLIVILGPTASGKTTLAARLAADLNGEIISADSRQVYKGMNIGTGKDLNQYTVNGRSVPYHLIDIMEPQEEFNLFEFQRRFRQAFDSILQRKKLPVLVGGTGLYLESVLLGYQMPEALPDEERRNALKIKTKSDLRKMLLELKPRMHNKTDYEDTERLMRAIEIEMARKERVGGKPQKPVMQPLVFGVRWERNVLRQRITERLAERLENGMLQEGASLHAAGLSWARLESFGLEYRWISRYLQNKITYDEMKNRLNIAIHQFAKRQDTWFRRMEKKGVLIHWLDGDNYDLLKKTVTKALQ